MRLFIVSVLAAVVPGTLAPPAVAHVNGWAFPDRAIRQRESGLRFTFNRLFRDFGPHEVNCWGLNPVRLNNGGRGYRHIRCRVESMSVPDFIYHMDRSGRVFPTRAWG